MATKKAALLSELQNKSGSHCAEGDFDIAVCMPMMGVLMERHHIPTTNGNRALLSLCAFFSMCFFWFVVIFLSILHGKVNRSRFGGLAQGGGVTEEEVASNLCARGQLEREKWLWGKSWTKFCWIF